MQSRRFALLDNSVMDQSKVPVKSSFQNKGTKKLQLSCLSSVSLSQRLSLLVFVSTLVGLLCESQSPSVTFLRKETAETKKHPRFACVVVATNQQKEKSFWTHPAQPTIRILSHLLLFKLFVVVVRFLVKLASLSLSLSFSLSLVSLTHSLSLSLCAGLWFFFFCV